MGQPSRSRRALRNGLVSFWRTVSLGSALSWTGVPVVAFDSTVWHSSPPKSFQEIAPFLGIRMAERPMSERPDGQARLGGTHWAQPQMSRVTAADASSSSWHRVHVDDLATDADPAGQLILERITASADFVESPDATPAADEEWTTEGGFPILDDSQGPWPPQTAESFDAARERFEAEATEGDAADRNDEAKEPRASATPPLDASSNGSSHETSIVNPFAGLAPPANARAATSGGLPQGGRIDPSSDDAANEFGAELTVTATDSVRESSDAVMSALPPANRTFVSAMEPTPVTSSATPTPLANVPPATAPRSTAPTATAPSAAVLPSESQSQAPDPSILPMMQNAADSLVRLEAGVVQQAQEYINQGIRQAERGAIFSARLKFIKVLRLVSQSLDAENHTSRHSQALATGLRALDEAAEFRPGGSELEANLDLRPLVAGHRTPVLKQRDLTRLTPLVAIQEYHAFAEQQLGIAGGSELVAADAYFGLAKLQPHLAKGRLDHDRYDGPVSMSYYQAALMVYPDHYLAANELGVLFARFGQLQDAREVLQYAASANPGFPETWLNLSRVHQQLGETDLARRAYNEWEATMKLANRPLQQVSTAHPPVQWLNPTEFARTAEGLPQAAAESVPVARAAARENPAAPSAADRSPDQVPQRPSRTAQQKSAWPFR